MPEINPNLSVGPKNEARKRKAKEKLRQKIELAENEVLKFYDLLDESVSDFVNNFSEQNQDIRDPGYQKFSFAFLPKTSVTEFLIYYIGINSKVVISTELFITTLRPDLRNAAPKILLGAVMHELGHHFLYRTGMAESLMESVQEDFSDAFMGFLISEINYLYTQKGKEPYFSQSDILSVREYISTAGADIHLKVRIGSFGSTKAIYKVKKDVSPDHRTEGGHATSLRRIENFEFGLNSTNLGDLVEKYLPKAIITYK